MDNSQLSEQINKKYASLKRHEANVERLINKEPFTEFDDKKLHREKYMVRKIRKAISNIEEHLEKNNNMITEDYVSFEIAKLLKEKGFDGFTEKWYLEYKGEYTLVKWGTAEHPDSSIDVPTLQMAMKWLRETHNVLVIPDYDYECTDKPYCYKIYKLGENGKPERIPIEGVRYDTLNEPHTEIVAYRDYKRSYFDYKTYEEACEAGIKYCLENLN
jgi:hypothetical protein